MYRDLGHREGAGWLAGMSTGQAVTVGAGCVPPVVAVAAGRWSTAFGWALVAGVVWVLTTVPIRGRPAVYWLVDLGMFTTGVLMNWSRWQSRAAAGQAADPAVADLPGVLSRFRFHDGPPLANHRLCVIQDTVDGRWAITGRLTHSGVAMASPAERDGLAEQLGTMLIGVAHREVIDRVSLLVRTVPDDGTDYLVWREQHQVDTAPELTRRIAAEIDRDVAAASVRTELFVTVAGTEHSLRRAAKAAGGGVAGRSYALYRVLDGVADALRGLGVTEVTWLTSAAVAEAVRTGFNPAAAAHLRHQQLTRPDRAGRLPWSMAGPVLAPAPAARSYAHDGFATVAYAVQPPVGGTEFGSLGPLLAVRRAGERRSLQIHYEVLDPSHARRHVSRTRFRDTLIADLKATRGFGTTVADQQRRAGGHAHEAAVAAGHALVRYTIAAATTVPADWADWGVEDAAAGIENDASGRFGLLRLELAQDAAFVAACLPVGYGLPGLPQRRWQR
ncbi:SCO6880 family protein [Pseudonocardia sp. Ae717_Ps2]|uniref:SCO6880 family protein n=1 Tax=Pseudonocardia sp. Ae717_Ps2 TaxID=1885573 RepID=UPI001E5E702B|nr:SCO6880 family protein [Pseudonocardia sp. Ae717_Ps2]